MLFYHYIVLKGFRVDRDSYYFLICGLCRHSRINVKGKKWSEKYSLIFWSGYQLNMHTRFNIWSFNVDIDLPYIV